MLNKLLSLANNARSKRADPKAWNGMVWNTVTFTNSIFSVTGKVRQLMASIGGQSKGQFVHSFKKIYSDESMEYRYYKWTVFEITPVNKLSPMRRSEKKFESPAQKLN